MTLERVSPLLGLSFSICKMGNLEQELPPPLPTLLSNTAKAQTCLLLLLKSWRCCPALSTGCPQGHPGQVELGTTASLPARQSDTCFGDTMGIFHPDMLQFPP